MSSSSLLHLIMALVLLHRVKRSVKADGLLEKWVQKINAAMGFVVIVYALEIILKQVTSDVKDVAGCVWLFILSGIVYIICTTPDFHKKRPLATAMIPYLVVFFLSSLTALIFPEFLENSSTYFATAGLLSFVWMIAMWYTANRQDKARAREDEKRRLEDEMNKAIAVRKVQLEGEVAERTAELMRQKDELEEALGELRATQDQLIQQEKLASLGELTAGIAHEIQNPLNFVNNFSEVSIELLDEMVGEMGNEEWIVAKEIAVDIKQNLLKIGQHGKRADAIVKGMLQHSRKSTGQKEPTDLNVLADEYLRLSYHGLRAKDKLFNAALDTKFDPSLPRVPAIPQELGRVMLNMFNNAFYSVAEKKKQNPQGYDPTVQVITSLANLNGESAVEIRIRDNGIGIPRKVLDKIYQPFFTTKPTGEGTGLGLSLSYDIVTKVHGGELKVSTKEGEYAEFCITIPASD